MYALFKQIDLHLLNAHSNFFQRQYWTIQEMLVKMPAIRDTIPIAPMFEVKAPLSFSLQASYGMPSDSGSE